MSSKNKIQVGVALCTGYFLNSKVAIEYLLSQNNIGKIDISKEMKKFFSSTEVPFSLESGGLFLSAKYNFRHALELVMKSLIMSYNEEVPRTHDLLDLCNTMKDKLLNKSILSKSFEAWNWLINEYTVYDIFAGSDPKNELYRYMSDQSGNAFPYKKIHTLSKGDLKGFRQDIKTATDLFWRMDGERQFIEMCQKYGNDPNKKINQSSSTTIVRTKSGRYYTRRKSHPLPNTFPLPMDK